MINADVLFIGYRRAGTNFLVNWFKNHPQINHDDQQIADILYHPGWKPELVPKPGNKVYISCDESIVESVCVNGNPYLWRKFLYAPGCFNLVRYDVVLDPNEAAKRFKAVFPNARILMVIRRQVEWFESLYRSCISQLPPKQRTFNDYWISNDGLACRLAGFHDAVITAWKQQFADVLVLETEYLSSAETSKKLCAWLEVDHIPFPQERENVSYPALALLHKAMPFMSKLPFVVKSALRPFARYLPARNATLLSAPERSMIQSIYRDSNERTERILHGQDAHR